MLFVFFVLVLILPFLVIWIILVLSPSSLFLTMIVGIAVWFIVKSYKGWIDRKEKDSAEGADNRN
jgi:uncharacterized membrane protein